jgi:TonB family protein
MEEKDKKKVLFISIICLCATFAAAQKTVRKRTKSKPVQINSSQTNQTASDSNQKESSQFDNPLKIIDKPKASYPAQDKGTICAQGKVVLRVTFLDSGEIGRISVISGMGNGLTEQAVEAAKKIKFEPATKNGKPVSVTKPVEYSFTIY